MNYGIESPMTPERRLRRRLYRLYGPQKVLRILNMRDALACKRLPLPGMVWQREFARGMYSWPPIRVKGLYDKRQTR